MSIKFTKKRTTFYSKFRCCEAILLVFSTICLSFICISITYAASSKTGLSERHLNEFAQNNIIFYNPDECISSGGSGTICGNTAIEKYWSAISKYIDDPIDIAGIMGNIVSEGNFNPVEWEAGPTREGGGIDSSGNLYLGWDYYYDGHSSTTGVGAVAITSDLGHYLHYVNDNHPDLLKYYKDTKEYAYNWNFHPNGIRQGEESYGDDLLEKIGAAEFDKLVDLDVHYFMEEWPPTVSEKRIDNYLSHNATTPSEAAAYWAIEFERCQHCQPGTGEVAGRAQNAEFLYDLLKDFKCSGGSKSSASLSSSSGSLGTSSVSGSDIIWIGDSDSALAHDEEGYDLVERTFPGVGLYAQSGKVIDSGGDDNPSGLAVLEEIVKKGELRPYLVFAMGGNGGWGNDEEEMQKNMDKFLDLIDGKDVKVILTTTKYKTVDYPESNAFVKKIAEENPNIYLADVAANYKDEYFTEDPIEFNAEGGKMFVQTIKDALEQASSGSCTTYEGEYPQYIQWDEPWGGLPYSNGYYSDSACGAASMAMLATVATGQDIFPNDIGDFLEEQATLKKIPGGASPYYDSTSVAVLDPIVGEHYDFEVITDTSSTPEETKTKFRDYLQKGYMIHFTGAGHYPGFYPLQDGSDSKGHVIGLFGIDSEDNVMQANSAFGGNQKVSLDDMANAKIWSDFTAIKGKNSGRNTCNISNICKDSGTSTGSETSKPIEPIHEDSTDIPCDPRTIDLGIRDDAYYGERYSIRLCAIPNIKFNDMQGPDKELDDQYAHVNSRVSGAFYSLSEENKNTCGNYLEANDDFRTYEEQEDRCRTTNAICATPGSVYANHQGGLAIDFDTSTYCSSLTSGGYLSSEFLSKFGLQNAMDLNEPWHVDPEGSR